MVKPKVLAFNRYYLPGFRAGGPVRTLANMADRLSDDFQFYIVTTDRDKEETGPYPSIDKKRWNSSGKAFVWYFNKPDISIKAIVNVINEADPDLIYLNSYFDPLFTQRVLVARRRGKIKDIPIVLAPRGEFSESALKLKGLKKNSYKLISSFFGLYRSLVWQASSADELRDIKRNINCADNIRIALDLASEISFDSKATIYNPVLRGGEMKICFLSRIAPMKNLDFCLKALRKVRMPVKFNIYGPDEDVKYWSLCQDLIIQLPGNIEVSYCGEVKPECVRDILAEHDLFFLPTRGENYGHVIHEALSAGLPVLISDQTPWNAVADEGVGWVFPLSSTDTFSEKIDELSQTLSKWRVTMGEKAIRYAAIRSENADALEDNKRLFYEAIGRKLPREGIKS